MNARTAMLIALAAAAAAPAGAQGRQDGPGAFDAGPRGADTRPPPGRRAPPRGEAGEDGDADRSWLMRRAVHDALFAADGGGAVPDAVAGGIAFGNDLLWDGAGFGLVAAPVEDRITPPSGAIRQHSAARRVAPARAIGLPPLR